jgi:hypothetical protein
MDITDFVGTYTVREGSTSKIGLSLEIGDIIYVGTGTHGAPVVSGDQVGMSAWSGGTQIFPPPGTIAMFTYLNSSLHWEGLMGGALYQIQFSLSRVPGVPPWRALYGTVIDVDPEVVGAWGADDRP